MYSRFRIVFCIVFALNFLFSSCSTEKELDNLSYSNLSYGKSSSQVVDIVLPDFPTNINEPVNAILFIHGGGWQEGDKSVYADAITDVSKNLHVIAAAMNYRMFGEGANCEDMLTDIHSALSLIKDKAAQKGIAVNKIILMGASAGAHLSLLYTYKHHVNSPIPIAFCVGQSTPADFTDPNLYVGLEFGNYMLECVSKLTGEQVTISNYQDKTAALLSISPISYINSNTPPTLIAHGSKDILIPLSNAERLYKALTNVAAKVDFYIYKNSGHELDNDAEIDSSFYSRMMEYIQVYML